MRDKLNHFWINECFNIIITGPQFVESDVELFFNKEPVWIIHPKMTWYQIFKELGIENYYSLFGYETFNNNYDEYLLELGNQSFKFAVYNCNF